MKIRALPSYALLLGVLLFVALLLSSCAAPSPRAQASDLSLFKAKDLASREQILANLDDNLEHQEWEVLEDKIKLLLPLDPGFVELYYYQAKILVAKGKTQEALDLLTHQITSHPQEGHYLAIRGRLLRELDYSLSARQDLEEAMRKKGFQSKQLYWDLALIEAESKNFEAALLYLDQALAYAPEQESILAKKAELLWGQLQLWDNISRLRQDILNNLMLKNNISKIIDSTFAVTSRLVVINPREQQYAEMHFKLLSLMNKQKERLEFLRQRLQLLPADPWASLQYAVALIQENQLNQAQKVLEEALLKEPDEPDLIFQLGGIYIAKADWRKAEKYYRQGLEVQPEATWAKIQLAKVLVKLREYTEAIIYLEKAIADDTKDMWAYETLARIRNDQEDTWEAERVIVAGLEHDQDNFVLLSEYGQLLEKRHQNNLAIKAYEAAWKVNPKDYELLTRMGHLYHQEKQMDKAVEMLTQAMLLKPEGNWARSIFVEVLIDLDKDKEAMEILDLMIQQDGLFYWAHVKKAGLLEKAGKFDSALASIQKAILIKPQEVWMREVEGRILERMGDYENAYAAYQVAAKTRPDDARLLTRLAWAKHFIDRKAALQDVEEALNAEDARLVTLEVYLYLKGETAKTWGFGPQSPEARLHLNLMNQKWDEAKALFQVLEKAKSPHVPYLKILAQLLQEGSYDFSSLEPMPKATSPWHHFYRGVSYLHLEQAEGAKVELTQALQQRPHDPWIQLKLGYALELLKDYKPAIALFQDHLKKRPASIWGALRLALNYDLDQRPAEAEKVYQDILKAKPTEHVALNNLAWMYVTTPDPQFQKLDLALELSTKAVEISPSAANLDTLAEVLYLKKDYQKALKTIERALDMDNKSLDYFKQQKKKIQKALDDAKKGQ